MKARRNEVVLPGIRQDVPFGPWEVSPGRVVHVTAVGLTTAETYPVPSMSGDVTVVRFREVERPLGGFRGERVEGWKPYVPPKSKLDDPPQDVFDMVAAAIGHRAENDPKVSEL